MWMTDAQRRSWTYFVSDIYFSQLALLHHEKPILCAVFALRFKLWSRAVFPKQAILDGHWLECIPLATAEKSRRSCLGWTWQLTLITFLFPDSYWVSRRNCRRNWFSWQLRRRLTRVFDLLHPHTHTQRHTDRHTHAHTQTDTDEDITVAVVKGKQSRNVIIKRPCSKVMTARPLIPISVLKITGNNHRR